MGRWHGNGSDGVMGIGRLDLESIHLITRYLNKEERDLNVYTSELTESYTTILCNVMYSK